MCERIKTIKRYYNTLDYEINRQEALKKISTLHCELKLKDYNDFSDRFVQAASVIENNLSVFKSASDHVDIVTTIIDYLYSVSVKLMFNNKLCTADEICMIYLMFITCEDLEIPKFLKRALIYNSKLQYEGEKYLSKLTSNYVFEMIILQDADLYAVINYFRLTPFFLLNVKKIFVHELIIEKFLSLLEKQFKYFYTHLSVSIFRTMKDIFRETCCLIPTLSPDFFETLYMVSIWSENISDAKILASLFRRDITFINAHLEFCSQIKFSYKWYRTSFEMPEDFNYWHCEDGDKINPDKYPGLIYNLFYNGVWQEPVYGKYWIHNDNAYAHTTKEDIVRCYQSAKKAFKDWSFYSMDFRRKTLDNLAAILECNGKFLLAKIILKWTHALHVNNTSNLNEFNYLNERLEILSFYGTPKGVVFIYHESEITLFSYLTLALIMGNSVILLCNQSTCTVASYINMFLAAEIPPGVINLLFNKDVCKSHICQSHKLENFAHLCYIYPNYIILPLK